MSGRNGHYMKVVSLFKPEPQIIVDLSLYQDQKHSVDLPTDPASIYTSEGVNENYAKPLIPQHEKTAVSKPYVDNVNITWIKKKFGNTKDPSVWGPPKWFSLHNSAAYYPVNASPIVRDRMKGTIMGLPYTLPCPTCFNHAIAYIESRISELNTIVSGRDNLFKFWVDFHNTVNRKHGKAEMSLTNAWKMYTGKAETNVMSF
jgi:hypothetical protein